MAVIFESSEPGVLAVAKSLLDSEGIPFEAIGEAVQDLIGVGRLGGLNVATGPVRLVVHDLDADRARQLLKALLAPADGA